MDLFHFGDSPRKLYGVFMTPTAGARGSTAVLLCYPFGQEYMRAHRAFRQLATLINRCGLPAMRFDYYGTGDSFGEGEDASFDLWVANTRAAIEEIQTLAGVDRVHLVGLRLGAAVAAYAAEGRSDVESLVLWDPVVRGPGFVEEVRESGATQIHETWWINGFPLSAGFRESLAKVDIRGLQIPDDTRVLQVLSHESEMFEQLDVALRGHPGGAERDLVPTPGDWNYVDEVGGLLLPHALVKAIAGWLCG